MVKKLSLGGLICGYIKILSLLGVVFFLFWIMMRLKSFLSEQINEQ